MKTFFWLLILFFSTVEAVTQEKYQVLKQLHAIDLLNDHQSAILLAESALKEHPHDPQILNKAIKIFAHAGNEEEMIRSFRQLQAGYPEYPVRDLLEEISWGVIRKGSRSSSPMQRAISLIAAALGNDARGIQILKEKFKDPHRLVRLLTVDFAANFRDGPLKQAVKEGLETEKDAMVRLELISAIGKMQIREAKDELQKILENESATAEEKAQAIESMVLLEEPISRQDLECFVKSPRAGLRELAAALINHDERYEDIDLLPLLLQDPIPEVRKAALATIGGLRPAQIQNVATSEYIRKLLKDNSYEVILTAAWALALYEPAEGQAAIEPWLKSGAESERLYAAAALSATGKYGFPLIVNALQTTQDPYVRVNLALTMIQEKVEPAKGGQALFYFLNSVEEKIMEEKLGNFNVIAPSDIAHRPDIPNYPESVNQILRLELLNLLAILEHPYAFGAVKQFLKGRPWGVSGAAAAMLLTEGDDSFIPIVRELLKDPSEKIQLQAALILGQWSSDPEAIETLEKLYPKISRMQKEQILEAIAHIGEESSIPFLIDRLEEPQQTLRLIAATALLKILYH